MGDFIYTLLALKYSQICKCYVLRARVGGNANVLSQILCLGSTTKSKDASICILMSEDVSTQKARRILGLKL